MENNSIAKLQKELNSLSKCKFITGELYIETKIKATNYLELEKKINDVLTNLNIPTGFKINENLIYKQNLKIYLSFKKI